MTQTVRAGRLGNPAMTLIEDRRLDPRIRGLIEAAPALGEGLEPVTAASSLEDCSAYALATEAAAAAVHPMLEEAMPPYESVLRRTETIRNVDGGELSLYIHVPKDAEPGPCVVHTHGGGMVIMTAADPGFVMWRNDLASAGLRVVGVEFRNGGGKLGNHPFPAGLNDCASAVNWVQENKETLGVTSVVISGESGGGNLSIATTLKAKNEGWLDQIDGVYACCPYIYGDYLNPSPELGSLTENDGYSLDCSMMSALVKLYDPGNEHARNPLAWPYHASAADLEGLPPHVISVNELDPLRDEGLEFYRKLMAAGVTATARTVHGTPHAGDLSFPTVAADLYHETLNSLKRFARSLEVTT